MYIHRLGLALFCLGARILLPKGQQVVWKREKSKKWMKVKVSFHFYTLTIPHTTVEHGYICT
jgi:hypothetical protein